MKILLSPAKSIDTTRMIEVPELSVPNFIEQTEYLVNKLKKLSAKQIGKLMHVSTDLAQLNYERFQSWDKEALIDSDLCPAICAFTGEVYRGLDVETFSSNDFIEAQNTLRILSGLYGVLRPLDKMLPYRLEMGTSYKVTPKVTNLYKYWGTKLSDSLNKEMDNDEVIINLASNEYFKAVDLKVLKAKVITPVFKEFKNGRYKIVMMYAKHARGAMARYIIQNKIKTADELITYDVDGYGFDANQSTETEWVFVR